jgi:hypothetical protein
MKHRWSEPERFVNKTERSCLNACGIVKVTRHDTVPFPTIEFWRNEERLDVSATPACEAVREEAWR